MNNTLYFSHDVNARSDPKILNLRAEHGLEGYGIYWALVEMLFESSDSKIKFSSLKGISKSFDIDVDLLKKVINTCVNEELFSKDENCFWSNGVIKRKSLMVEKSKIKSEAGKIAAKARWDNHKKNNASECDSNTNDMRSHANTMRIDAKENKSNKINQINKIDKYDKSLCLDSCLDFLSNNGFIPSNDDSIKNSYSELIEDALNNSKDDCIKVINYVVNNSNISEIMHPFEYFKKAFLDGIKALERSKGKENEPFDIKKLLPSNLKTINKDQGGK